MATVPSPVPPEELKHGVKDALIEKVTVYQNRAEITRVLRTKIENAGLYDAVLEGLPTTMDPESLRVAGTGLFTILHISFRNELVEQNEEEEKTRGSEREKLQARLAELHEQESLLQKRQERSDQMRRVVEQYTANVASPPVPSQGTPLPPVGLETLDAVVAYCRCAMEKADGERAATAKEAKALQREAHALQVKLAELGGGGGGFGVSGGGGGGIMRQAVVSIDASAAGPVDLEIRYVVDGASWSPLYDIRISTRDSAIKCLYYANVQQTTGEDWDNVRSFALSTAEPAIQGTPPPLAPKMVNWRAPPPPVHYPMGGASFRGKMAKRSSGAPRPAAAAFGYASEGASLCGVGEDEADVTFGGGPGGGGGGGSGLFGAGTVGFGAPQAAMAPPPPPPAQAATAAVSGGATGGTLGAISYDVTPPVTVKCDGSRKKLTVGVLSLTSEVAHFVTAAQASAYLQAKATNDTDFQLLASPNVSVFFDNAFVTKTELNTVAPGESFQLFLGVDKSVRVTHLPPRKASKKSGLFSKTSTATHTRRTTLLNTKAVPVTVAQVDALPRSAQDTIVVRMRQPKQEVAEAINFGDDEAAVSAALQLAGEHQEGAANVGGSGSGGGASTRVFLNKDTNTVIWVAKIPPGQEVSVPFEYSIEWPSTKEIEIS